LLCLLGIFEDYDVPNQSSPTSPLLSGQVTAIAIHNQLKIVFAAYDNGIIRAFNFPCIEPQVSCFPFPATLHT
jgi:hypothetical protein